MNRNIVMIFDLDLTLDDYCAQTVSNNKYIENFFGPHNHFEDNCKDSFFLLHQCND